MKLAIRTRGYSDGYVWLNHEADSSASKELGAVLADDQPGFVIQKHDNGKCDILIGGIERPGQFDYRGRKISMQVFIGDISEEEARRIAVAVLKDWSVTAPFAGAITDTPKEEAKEKQREWNVQWDTLKEKISPLLSSESSPSKLPPSARSIDDYRVDNWQDDYSKKTELGEALRNCTLSQKSGLKIYWGGSPNTPAIRARLNQEADRLYIDGADILKSKPEREKKDGEEMLGKVMRGMIAVSIPLMIVFLLTVTQCREKTKPPVPPTIGKPTVPPIIGKPLVPLIIEEPVEKPTPPAVQEEVPTPVEPPVIQSPPASVVESLESQPTSLPTEESMPDGNNLKKEDGQPLNGLEKNLLT